MSDLISRADALKWCKPNEWHTPDERWRPESEYGAYINALPSAERKGKWVNNIHDMPICSECGYMTPYDRAIDDYEYGNYCPNCGARMVSEDE